MATWERYVKIEMDARYGRWVSIGLEYRDGDDILPLRLAMRACVWDVGEHDEMAHAQEIGHALRYAWPGRAFFVELGSRESNDHVQVYQPWGMPREDNK
jgi:hypothetical protein